MPYNEYTFDMLQERLGVFVNEVHGVFAQVPPIAVSDVFRANMDRGLSLATAMGSEKARSEFIIAPLLTEVREVMNRTIAIYSGAELNVDWDAGLYGYCDFIVGRSSSLMKVEAPILTVVEAKREDLTAGTPQCVAEMVAAQRFNARREHPTPIVYGAVTSGTIWRFLRLSGSVAEADLQEFYIEEPERILGVLVHMVQTSPAHGPVREAGGAEENR